MITFKSLEKIQPYYSKDTNTYKFMKNRVRLDVKFNFDINIESNIIAGYVKAKNIDVLNIDAWDIKANDINAWNIDVWRNIKAKNISYYAICVAYEDIICNSIESRHDNGKYFCLRGEMIERK